MWINLILFTIYAFNGRTAFMPQLKHHVFNFFSLLYSSYII